MPIEKNQISFGCSIYAANLTDQSLIAIIQLYKFQIRRGVFMCKSAMILLICTFLGLPSAAAGAADRRVALVIGNSNYMAAPLRNPVNDATDMAKALKQLGFKVTLKTDANQRKMEASIRAFGDALRSGGVGLFYYAGHGIQYRGTNYLIPVHADIKSEADVKYETVDAGRVLSQMERAGNNLNIVILDACRNNPFARSFRSSEKGLAKMDAPTGSILAYATAPGSVAADGSGKNGLYTEKLLKNMQIPGMDLPHLFMKVRREVVAATNRQQVPWESSSLIGDFHFVSTRGVAVAEKSKEQEAPIAVAAIPPEVSEARVVKRDGSFERLANGIVFDAGTGLEWYVGPDRDTNWTEAKKWTENLDVPADKWRLFGGGWRLPTLGELRSLYRKGAGGTHMTPLLQISGSRVWSSKKKTVEQRLWNGEIRDASLAGAFVFSGGYEYWETMIRPNGYRAFAVRKRK